MKEYSNKMGYKSKVLGAHVLNPKMMSVGEDNNRQTDRQTYSSQKAQTHIKRDQIK